MKIRSQAFLNYLFETGMFNGTPEQIAIARHEYRKLYKRAWKQAKLKKEIRIEFALDQFTAIQHHAGKCKITHTAFARNAILRAIGLEREIKKSPELLAALQLVSMTINAALREQRPDIDTLRQVETLLLQYLNVI